MATLYRTFAVLVLFVALAVWSKVAALNEASIIIVSPSSGATDSSSMLSTYLSMTATATTMAPSPTTTVPSPNSTVTPSPNTTVPSPNSTVTPSPNTTTMPSPNSTVTPSPNTTTMPSPNSTVTPSPNTTTMPSPNSTVTPSPNTTTMPSPNSTVTPSPNMTATSLHSMTIMPHNNTVTPSHSMTIMPSSAHSVMPTSSAHPTPPSPNWGNFSVKDENNTVCLIANMGALFNIKNGSKESTIKLPVNASTSGACAKNSSKPYITLQWRTPEGSYNFTMHFGIYANKKENLNAASSKRWAAANLSFSLETEDGAGMFTFHSAPDILKQLSADLGSSYECLTSATDFLLMADNNSSVNVSLIHIRFQPFEVQGGHLSKAEVCATPAPTTHSPSGKTTVEPTKKSESHVVAIAVGCSLAGLVVIVIVGYVIGRRRSRNASVGYRKL